MRPWFLAVGAVALSATVLAADAVTPAEPAAAVSPVAWGPLTILERAVQPGQRQKLSFILAPSFAESFLDTIVVVTRGATPGATLCVTAGIHGDELNGVEIARRVYAGADPQQLAGTLIVLPVINAAGFRSGSRYLPDRRDLNRFFPGSRKGSTASRIAGAVFREVIQQCDALVDLHTGSFYRTNLPQIRTDLDDPLALALASSFGVGVVLHGRGPKGSLRRAALDAGVPAIVYEAGEPLRFEESQITRGVEGIRHVMAHLGLLPRTPSPPQSRVYRQTRWVRVPAGTGGIFLSKRQPGDDVGAGHVLGTVTDLISDESVTIESPVAGRIIGMATPQLVLPGSALFHIGLAVEPLAPAPADSPPAPDATRATDGGVR